MTMPTLVAICAAVQDVVEDVTGIRFAPDVPPEQQAGGDVSAYCWPGTGTTLEITDGQQEAHHTLHLYIITPQRNQRTDFARVIALGDTVPGALLKEKTLSGTVLQIDQIRYTFGQLEWGGGQNLGWMFEIDVLASGSL
jgi:hypothetical protein